ncbi:Gfo/Idh/MocA family protein [Serratia sp. (in: enterobacteria)]|uniref:Gfo/Idh/MocA family protein n=1 Tax=Serratia sp. (in: enterobacteria) TaxID=616 RepID=UPI003989F69A
MILIVGAGPMAQEYYKVVKDLDGLENEEVVIIGRNENSAQEFYKNTGKKVVTGGVNQYLLENKCALSIKEAIVAVGVEALYETTVALIHYGVKKILVEKPAGLVLNEIKLLSELASKSNCSIYVAYNRRFFSSVLKARELIEQDGGLESFVFEVTEWASVIEKIKKADGVKENWFLANSSHIVDLAFFLGGKPNEIASYVSGHTTWHSRSANFVGAGRTTNDVLFSYHGNWNSPGRWSLELSTVKSKYIFRPIEKLQIQKINSINSEFVEVDDSLDIKYKPGLYLQVKSFLSDNTTDLCCIDEHYNNSIIYSEMAGYSKKRV